MGTFKPGHVERVWDKIVGGHALVTFEEGKEVHEEFTPQEWKEYWDTPVVVQIDELWEHHVLSGESPPAMADIPCLAPVFDYFVVEMNNVWCVDKDPGASSEPDLRAGCACIFNYTPIEEALSDPRWHKGLVGEELKKYHPHDKGWILSLHLYFTVATVPGHVIHQGNLLLFIDKDGKPGKSVFPLYPPQGYDPEHPTPWLEITAIDFIYEMVLHALGLLHCKNIEAVDAPVVGTRQQIRKLRRARDPDLQFKVLRVKPPRGKRSQGETRQVVAGEQPMHLVRGHYKHYTPENPLFGKIVGTWWWGSHVRGNPREGIVVKDYEVDPLLEMS